jgi:hypothetical protein
VANSGRLRGFTGQRMAAKTPNAKLLSMYKFTTGSGTIQSPPYATICEFWAIGAGGGAAPTGGPGSFGGDGGGAAYKRFRCGPNLVLTYSIGVGGTTGADGTATTITMPTGLVVSGGGGQGFAGSHVGGVGSNGDINRRGGGGSNGGNSGSPGEFGGAGGVGTPSFSGGGGAAGFSDLGFILGGSGGGSVANGSAPGGGGGVSAGNGADGQLLVTFTRLTGV